ncbi:MAG TPA: hypothetical protein PKB13_07600 [Clostridia bacterium]|nr:hypothetical protein [Clostridia bacterium]
MPKDAVKLSFGLTRCEECEKMHLAMMILRMFQWHYRKDPLRVIDFDRDTGEIVVDEANLMRVIQLANPAQRQRRIRLRRLEEAEQ